tara:strand:- start:15 stop:164 length:150 start_codon:yes stop_codon:yes gene_type:complete
MDAAIIDMENCFTKLPFVQDHVLTDTDPKRDLLRKYFKDQKSNFTIHKK